jgi:hypothetical protein
MVMFKAKFKPLPGRRAGNDKPGAQQQQQPRSTPKNERKAPPIEQERGPQYPVREPGPGNPPERAR